MKILRQGDRKTDWKGQWDCPNCRCAWKMEDADKQPKKHISTDQRDPDSYEMPCPNCGYLVHRAIETIPGSK